MTGNLNWQTLELFFGSLKPPLSVVSRNEQQLPFNRKVIKRSSAAVKALECGNIGKAKEELNEGISLLNNRQKLVKLVAKSEFGWATE